MREHNALVFDFMFSFTRIRQMALLTLNFQGVL